MSFLSTQMILSWTLLGVLLAWMLSCAFLAFRSRTGEKREATDLPTPSGAFSAVVPLTPLHTPSHPVDVSLSGVSAVATEAMRDIDVAPVV